MTENNKEILNKIDHILNKIEIIESKIDNLLEQNVEISKNTQRMDSHITFVENTYNNIKSPFHFLMNKVNTLSSISNLTYRNN